MKNPLIPPAIAIALACMVVTPSSPAFAQGSDAIGAPPGVQWNTALAAGGITPHANPSMDLRKVVQTWSYVGPRARLKGARIELRDRNGRLLQAGTTNRNGYFRFNLTGRRNVAMPLEVTTTGGRIIGGTLFKGRLRARVFTIGLRSGGVVQTSLISTAASKMSSSRKGYASATAKVRKTLGISKGAYPWVLGLGNLDVGYRQLARAAARAGGFDAFASEVARRAQAGKRIGGLRPASLNASGPKAPRAKARPAPKRANQTVVAPSTSFTEANCGVSSLTNDNGGTSTAVIDNVGEIAMSGLLKYAGAPSSAATSVTGMLFTAVGAGGTVTNSNAQAGYNYANCILEILGAIEQQLQKINMQVSLQSATSCQNQLTGTNGWYAYQTTLGQADQFPINGTNTALVGTPAAIGVPAIPGYLTDWSNMNTSCGQAIPNMLWGSSASGITAVWPQMLKQQSAGGPWVTQAQVQNLQNFMSYWGTLAYNQFALQNEVYNWVGTGPGQQYQQAAQTISGLDYSKGAPYTNSAGLPVCKSGATASDPTYCVMASNLAQAYPGTLYSDEVGVMSTGVSINAIPGGMVAPPPIPSPATSGTQAASKSPNIVWVLNKSYATGSYSPLAMNPAWTYNYYLTWNPSTNAGNNDLKIFFNGGAVDCVKSYTGKCPMSGSVPAFDSLALQYFQGKGVNPNGYGSAVQTYSNPQNTNRSTAVAADVSALKSSGPNGLSATQALYNGVNQAPSGGSGPWSTISSGQALYMTTDSGFVEAYVPAGAKLTWSGALGASKSGWQDDVADIPSTPVFAFLTKRSWWSTASTAQANVNSTSYPLTAPPTG